MNRRIRQQRASGFSLVEMLVALTIFGLLSAAGVAVLAHAADNRDVVSQRMDRIAELQRGRALLGSDLGQVAMRRVRGRDGTPARNAFVGGTSGALAGTTLFGFVRRGWSNPDAEPRASLQYVEYRLVDGRLERSVRAALDGAAPGVPQVVLTGVRGVRVRYRFREQWSTGWPGGAEALPQALGLTLDLDGIGELEQLFLLPETAA